MFTYLAQLIPAFLDSTVMRGHAQVNVPIPLDTGYHWTTVGRPSGCRWTNIRQGLDSVSFHAART